MEDYNTLIRKHIESGALLPDERTHLFRDLKTVYDRLGSGEYRVADFSSDRVFDVPGRTREFFSYLKSYERCARTIAHHLASLSLQDISRACDLCPGWAPKVGMALHYSGYSGQLSLLDSDASRVRLTMDFMAIFEPSFRMVPCVQEVFSSASESFPLVLGNHILDDLSFALWQTRHRDTQSIYESEEAFREVGLRILGLGDAFFEEALSEVLRVLDGMVEPGGYLFVSQYQSMMERLLGLSELSAYFGRFRDALKAQLLLLGYMEVYLRDPSAFEPYFSSDECFLLRRPAS